jgi:hypothetical protein
MANPPYTMDFCILYLFILFRIHRLMVCLKENRIRMRFLPCFQTQIPTVDSLLFFLHHQPHSSAHLGRTHICHGTTNIRMTWIILPIHPRISCPVEIIDPLREHRVRRCTDYHQLSSHQYNGDILSVTCFAQMKYACILFIPHPTGGLRLIDSRLCSLLPISLISVIEGGRTLQV